MRDRHLNALTGDGVARYQKTKKEPCHGRMDCILNSLVYIDLFKNSKLFLLLEGKRGSVKQEEKNKETENKTKNKKKIRINIIIYLQYIIHCILQMVVPLPPTFRSRSGSSLTCLCFQ